MGPYWWALVLSTAVNLALLIRLVVLGTRRQCPVFFWFVCVQLVENAVSLALGTKSHLYLRFWVVTTPLNPVLYVLMIREAYHHAFVEYPGISSLARWMTYGSGVAALLSLALLLKFSPEKEFSTRVVINYSFYWEECMAFGLTVFVLFMIFLLWRYPIRLRFNLACHIAILCSALLMDAVFLAIVPSETSFLAKVRNYGIAVLWLVCFTAWGVLLRKDFGLSVISVRQNLTDDEVNKRLEQLDKFNKMLK